MTSQQSSKHSGWFTGRTRLITVVSIVGVAVAGASAVSANIGILDSASDTPVGHASVTGALATPSTQVVDVYLPEASVSPATTLADAGPVVQQFTVDVAGTVAVAATDSGLRLDSVDPASGWTWSLAQSDSSALAVTMTNGTRTFEFAATMTPDGKIAASVEEPIVTAARADDHGNDAGDDDHADEHDDDHADDHGEYEGGEDDD